MTTLRQAAQQALEALNLPSMKTQQMLIQRDEAIVALREALAQPAQRPWQGLTDEEVEMIEAGIGYMGRSVTAIIKEAEAKLKERNT